MSTQATDRAYETSPDVQRVAQRLGRPRARCALGVKRAADVLVATLMLLALLPVLLVVVALLTVAGDGWTEHRRRLGRRGRTLELTRFRELPGGALGRALERAGARDLPLLLAVLRGRLSLVGPRAPEPGPVTAAPRWLMAPGLIGPAQRSARSAAEADALDDAYVRGWTLWSDARLLLLRPRRA